MKIVFFGATKFSEDILNHLIKNDMKPLCLFTIPKEFEISYSQTKVKNYNYSELETIAIKHDIPCYYVDSANTGKKTIDYFDEIKALKPDIILVLGWYYKVPKEIRNIAKFGAWGIHASMLPDYAGGAPLVWAIINGETETGVTLFKLDEGVDDGDIIVQKNILIKESDSIKEVYAKATKTSKNILVKALKNIENTKFIKQNRSKIKVYPQRKPENGEIDLSKSSKELYDFIRAQSSPYPGAFIKTVDGKKLIIEKARIQE